MKISRQHEPEPSGTTDILRRPVELQTLESGRRKCEATLLLMVMVIKDNLEASEKKLEI